MGALQNRIDVFKTGIRSIRRIERLVRVGQGTASRSSHAHFSGTALNDSAVCRIYAALRQAAKRRLELSVVLRTRKEHRGRYVLYFRSRADLGSWHSTAELLPLADGSA